MLPRTFLERAQGLRCGNDPNDAGVTQELRTGWLLDHRVNMPLNMVIICLKALPLCAEGTVVDAFGDCPF